MTATEGVSMDNSVCVGPALGKCGNWLLGAF